MIFHHYIPMVSHKNQHIFIIFYISPRHPHHIPVISHFFSSVLTAGDGQAAEKRRSWLSRRGPTGEQPKLAGLGDLFWKVPQETWMITEGTSIFRKILSVCGFQATLFSSGMHDDVSTVI